MAVRSVIPSGQANADRAMPNRYSGLCLAHCRNLGLRQVLITCNRDNEASRRTILATGGIYEATVQEPHSLDDLERYWVTL